MRRSLGNLNRLACAVIAVALACAAIPAGAVSLIRDAETEAVLRRIADPIFSAARLDPGSIDIYIINDPQLNAFVAGGQNLFVNTGLILQAEKPEELAGVIAHETGHIAGGHLSRMAQAQQQAGIPLIAGMLLGAAAAVAGAPELGQALMAGGATVGQRGLLKFSRSQEQSADQAAVTYLAANQMSPEGLLEFFHILENQNLRISRDGNEYLRTHPLTQDRINFLEQQVAKSPYKAAEADPALYPAYDRVVAKLDGFLDNPAQVIQRRKSDSVPDRYARAIAYYRVPDTKNALSLVDGLIKDYPHDPYFYELKGQILFENGQIAESIAPNREALRYRPDSPLIRLGLARSLMESGNDKDLPEAAALLHEVVRLEPDNPGPWRFLGIVEGRLGNEGASALALTEQAVLVQNRKDAQLYLNRAKQFIGPDDPDWYRLQDLERATEDIEEPPPRRR
ncbi:MAG: M48 family metalloprotease [Geminicoccaceae bacterium]